MSLFNQASLVVTPNGYKAGKLYSIKPTSGAGDLDVVRATGATRVNASGLIETVANNVPRLDYTGGGCPSILVEPQRTNLVLRSEEFDDASWIKSDSTITANTVVAPDGNLTGDKWVENSGALSSQPRLRKDISTPGTHSATIYAKAGGRNWLRMQSVSSSPSVWFNLATGTIGTVGINLSASIQAVGNGWYRCTLVKPSDTRFHCFISDADGSTEAYTGDGTSGIFIWGAQLEAGANATSYIPTVASTVTRNADVISKTGVSALIGQTEGTIYAEIKVNKLIGTAARYIFHLSDGTVNNRIYMAFSGSSSNVLRARIFNGGALQCSIDTSALTNTGTYKLALAYKNNDIVFYVNGVQIGVDTSATIPTCSRVDLGQNYAGASLLGDGINNANIWKTRLTNTELATLTTL